LPMRWTAGIDGRPSSHEAATRFPRGGKSWELCGGRPLAPRARLRGDVCTHFAAVLAARGARWGYVVTVDEDGCGKWTNRDESSIPGLCPGRFELARVHGPWKPGFARTSFGLRSDSGHF